MKRICMLVIVVIIALSFVSCTTETTTQNDTATPSQEQVAMPTNTPEETVVPIPTETPTEAPTEKPIANDKPYEVFYEETFEVFDPFTEILSDDLLRSIGADGFTGTEKEIADQILQWQNKNMQYIGNPMEKEDISHPMRWNYCLPGIFPVSEMVVERVLPDGKIYGLCWDYASIYCSIATTYGLETRVTAVKQLISDLNPNIDKSTANGLSHEEYEEFYAKIAEKGANFTFDQISRIVKETWAHYRAEVLIDGQWVAMDGAAAARGDSDELEEVTWYEGYDNKTLYEENTNATFLDEVCEALKNAPADGYVGIIDDAGNSNRAANILDLNAGMGLAPYFDDVQDAIDFLEIEPSIVDELVEEEREIKEEFESMTGEMFYVVADALIFNAFEELDAENYVKYYKALTGIDMQLDYAIAITED